MIQAQIHDSDLVTGFRNGAKFEVTVRRLLVQSIDGASYPGENRATP